MNQTVIILQSIHGELSKIFTTVMNNTNNLRFADDVVLFGENMDNLKTLRSTNERSNKKSNVKLK